MQPIPTWSVRPLRLSETADFIREPIRLESSAHDLLDLPLPEPIWMSHAPTEPYEESLSTTIEQNDLGCPAVKLQLKQLLGQGAFGTVFRVCDSVDCEKVIKVQLLPTERRISVFEDEISKGVRAHNKGYGPKLFWGCVSDGQRLQTLVGQTKFNLEKFADAPAIGITVQEAWDGSLDQLPARLWCNANVLAQLENQVDRMHEDGFVHADLLPKNVLYKWNNGNILVTLADFGNSFPIANPPSDSWLTNIYNYFWYHPKAWQPTDYALQHSWLKNITLEQVLAKPELLDEPMLEYVRRQCPNPAARGIDTKGSFYQRLGHSRHYYNVGNAKSRAVAKQKAAMSSEIFV